MQHSILYTYYVSSCVAYEYRVIHVHTSAYIILHPWKCKCYHYDCSVHLFMLGNVCVLAHSISFAQLQVSVRVMCKKYIYNIYTVCDSTCNRSIQKTTFLFSFFAHNVYRLWSYNAQYTWVKNKTTYHIHLHESIIMWLIAFLVEYNS